MINNSLMSKIIFIIFLAYAPASFSETLLEAGIHMGGDELIIDNYSNGAKDSAKAGNLFSFAIGGMKSFAEKFEAQLSIGIKSDIITSGEPEITWIRYPLNAMVFYRAESYRIGLGLTDHLSPKIEGNGIASNISETYKDAIGALLEVDIQINTSFLWGLRYTNITYESRMRNRSVDGNSLGLLIIALF